MKSVRVRCSVAVQRLTSYRRVHPYVLQLRLELQSVSSPAGNCSIRPTTFGNFFSKLAITVKELKPEAVSTPTLKCSP